MKVSEWAQQKAEMTEKIQELEEALR